VRTVTFHQPNLLPGWSVISKVLASDVVVWMDTVQYTKGGWTNRQKMPDGSWLTVPVAHGSSFAPINKVRIGKPRGDWRIYANTKLQQAWPSPITDRVCEQVLRAYPLLVGLNAALLQIVLGELGYAGEQHWQSHLDEAHAVVAVSDDEPQLAPISERIAQMVSDLKGDVYLSGPSGRHYLDERPFYARKIDVEYWGYEGPNPCSLAVIAGADTTTQKER